MNLPSYDNPPLVETVLGIQFDSIPDFGNAFLGAFWASLDRNEWSQVADAPPLPPQFENFTEAEKWASGLRLKFSTEMTPRLQIVNTLGDKMIQIQNGRFIFNWRKKESQTYPRFDAIYTQFTERLKNFREFLNHNGLNDIHPNQWEVNYVNRIPQGTVWGNPDDWSFLKLIAPIPSDLKPLKTDSFAGEWHFNMANNKGRLHVVCKHGLNEEDKTEFVLLTLVARGPVEASDDIVFSALTGCQMGHEVVVKAFREIMSEKANKYWGLNNA